MAADLKDVTQNYRPNLSAEEAAKEPHRVMVPRGGSIRVTCQIGKDGKPKDPARLIQSILDSLRPGTFKLVRDEQMFHILPVRYRDRDGRLIETVSPLDTRISLPQKDRKGYEMLEAICDAIARQDHIQIGLGSMPRNLMAGVPTRLGGENVTARDLLKATVAVVDSPASWRLLWAPGSGLWALNFHDVPRLAPPSKASRRLPPWLVRPVHHRDPDSQTVGQGDGGVP